MCGIVGYIGKEQAAPILLAGLKKLEYRGYDSAGLAVRDEATGKIDVVKAKGRLHILEEKTDGGKSVPGSCGIGHTRWATHGEPSETNAHPHSTDDHSVALVHNGIIENYQELKEKLLKEGYQFHSATDTEVAVKLIDYYYKKTGNPLPVIHFPNFVSICPTFCSILASLPRLNRLPPRAAYASLAVQWAARYGHAFPQRQAA